MTEPMIDNLFPSIFSETSSSDATTQPHPTQATRRRNKERKEVLILKPNGSKWNATGIMCSGDSELCTRRCVDSSTCSHHCECDKSSAGVGLGITAYVGSQCQLGHDVKCREVCYRSFCREACRDVVTSHCRNIAG